MNQTIIQKIRQIRCLICDVDGVLTDGRLYIDSNGNDMKSFHVQDGMGLKLLMAAGVEVAVITTSNTEVIDKRMAQLGVIHYFKGQVDKREAYQSLKEKLNLVDEQIAYIGDDYPDLPLIKWCGLGIAVANAIEPVKQQADWVTQTSGGNGAVREVCDAFLTAKDCLNQALESYYQ
ncbi:KdsC family phosphatase [Legionella sp. W05-934-2]|jgi:3-deoxy-D-manno-octulosonate 8-phosphate phosphatase (KDO 8-P phosphatase)|uniref:KdsC family phosphatase n=1 Tax=Legionella sp. W05-934-2 TaxID=1198649 RepID=UPI0034636725